MVKIRIRKNLILYIIYTNYEEEEKREMNFVFARNHIMNKSINFYCYKFHFDN